jgi:hypothetical protein
MRQVVHSGIWPVRCSEGGQTETMKTKLLAMALLAAGTTFAADFYVGVRIGPPPAPRIVRYRPPPPGPGCAWVDGYWYATRHRYRWHDGYWTRPPYVGSVWYAPRYEGGLFYEGYWRDGRGEFRHDHHRDRDHDRDDSDHR